jgi:hypothetical protein
MKTNHSMRLALNKEWAVGACIGDGHRPRRKALDQAQTEAGVPPGVWTGRALPAVGLPSGQKVTERQMRQLFGEGPLR